MNHLKSTSKYLYSYDIIICGGGMAGLSLVYQLSCSNILKDLSILIIDKEPKITNDRTWAFWEKNTNVFENIVFKKWDKVLFVNQNKNRNILDLHGYQYKLIKGIDFYNNVYLKIGNLPNIHFCYENIESIVDNGNSVQVITENNAFRAAKVFDSTYKLNLDDDTNQNVLQHFKGIVIKTPAEVFDTEIPVMMDFSIIQKQEECRFMYLLPFSKNEALVEFTLFTESLLTEKEYSQELNAYIKNNLGIGEYEIIEEEFGVIPMSDVSTTERPSKNIWRIGTAAGYTNSATGYTFAFTQKRIKQLVVDLEKNCLGSSKQVKVPNRHKLYASILLNVILKKRCLIADVFNDLYTKNPPHIIFKFLDNETNFMEELKIMSSTPIVHFGKAAIDVLYRRIFR
jgi:lycopene beta-cyclase